jgi:hypothetical protein
LHSNSFGRQPRIIAGSGRSGTTWIQDVIAETNRLRPIFEPLHPQAIPAAAPFSGRYVAPDATEPELTDLFDSVVSGDLKTIWSDYRIRPRVLLPRRGMLNSLAECSNFVSRWQNVISQYYRYRPMRAYKDVIIKLIRGNLMLSWLQKCYDSHIVYVVRHPGAVIESRLRISGSSWDPAPVLKRYRDPAVLGILHHRYAGILNRQLDHVEAQALIWCIENQFPMQEAEKGNYALVFYEHLVTNGENEWARITNSLALDQNPHGNAIVNKPSQQAVLNRVGRIDIKDETWLDRLNQRHIDSLGRILEELGVVAYRADKTMPLVATDSTG